MTWPFFCDACSDGTTSMVVFIGELMKQAERYISEGLHPRIIVDGYDLAKKATLEFLEGFKDTANAKDRCAGQVPMGSCVHGGLRMLAECACWTCGGATVEY